MLTVGDEFPQFSAPACVGPDADKITNVDNKTYSDKWVVYFFYPKDFTFVCPTELVEFNNARGELADRDTVVVGGSTDNEYSHLAWCQSHDDLKKLEYPMIAAQKLAFDLGIVHPEANACTRSTFLVDPHNVIQWCASYPLSVGRNVEEVIRVIDAIQSDELCPCNWKKGEEFLKV